MKNTFRFFLGGNIFLLLLISLLCPAENIKLKNGVSVILDTDPSATTTAVQIWVSVGSVNEDKNISGISHFIEHLIFKGTPTRTQKQIAPKIEKFGGEINAETSKDFTNFHTVVPSSYSIEAAQILADAVLNPVFPPDEIEKERKVVLEEVKRGDDNPQTQLFDEFYKLVYAELPYAQRVIGTAENVSRLQRDDFIAFHNKYYIPENIFVVVSGNFDKKEMLDLLKGSFGKLEKGKKEQVDFSISKPVNLEKSAKITIHKDVTHAYVLMGFPAADIRSSDQYPLDLATYILGSGRASRLYKQLVEETGLAYNISSSFETQKGPGLFYVYAECAPENVSELTNKILLALNELTVEPPSNEELDRARTLLVRDKLLEDQTPEGKAGDLGFYAVLGNAKISDIYLNKIKKVSPGDIKDVISEYLISPNIPTVIVTP